MILETIAGNGYLLARILIAEANLDVAPSFKTEMTEVVDKGKKWIILDFKNVTYVDSSFLGALVSSLKYAIAKNEELVLVELHKDIHDLLKLIRMDKVFKIYKSEQDALQTLGI
ncbi:MAG: STAS domain-containing protein [Filimonas sp.]|nr:STAS domain-containing protein [Filimonas sp.]